ncbi:mitochondrial tricarboxylate transporter [Kockovaella imperatae]|uniref:Mitochondrial tricarboxylate transporter n=1 Tax=Kockovaella imperatae TaxID=4999 RepID=A0A1Y1UGC2_9TREE|nr:mitochondrial tricarboxylate transporter [Kockovaella imperatae]ORX37072.1 mitochondrial tricarboxylate transporter [Kockovaella imperatae]
MTLASSSKPSANRKPTSYESLMAGVAAGAIEGAITYPTEFVKTRAQFSADAGGKRGVMSILTDTIKTRGISGLYSGSGAMIAGNGLKAGVRFLTYDSIKELLRDSNGKMTPGRTVLAGLAAGVVEATIAVTPSETIKTKLIQDASSLQPQYTNMVNGTIGICRTEGVMGIYRGLWPTIMKQGANSAVRFTSYAWIQGLMINFTQPPSGKLSSTMTFGAGAMAGLITVYTTMPLDNIKTRMQSTGASLKYRNSLDCLTKIIREEGVQRLWGGTTPRLARLMMSGGIVFAVYERLIGVMTSL